MTALTGLAQSFTQLALARIGVGIGEAACSPPAHSLLSDYFPPDRRGTALSIFSLGVPIGIMIGYLAGGWVNQYFGWRTAFFVVGLPGVVLALIVRLTLREPPVAIRKVCKEQQPSQQILLLMSYGLCGNCARFAICRSQRHCMRCMATASLPLCQPL